MTDPRGASGIYLHPIEVRWGDCDPAGIVYYPRFFDFFHQAMEGWFAAELGAPYHQVINGRKIGFPSVHTEADFRAPSSFGDRLDVELRVGELGGRSIRFDYRVLAAGAVRITGATICVVMDLDPGSAGFRRAIPIPPDLRTRIERFRAGQ